MKITEASIRRLKLGHFDSQANEGARDIKILPYLSVVQSTEGFYEIALGNERKQQTVKGGFFIAPANVMQTIVHHTDPISKTMSARWVFLDVQINASRSLDELFKFPTVINDQQKQELNALFDALFQADTLFAQYSYCYQLLDALTRQAAPRSLPEHEGLSRAIASMTRNYRRELGVDEMAQAAHMSKSNFHAAFKKQLGLSPLAYLNHYRLSLAAESLRESSTAIKEIACAVGIRDPLYFSKLFKKTYGLSPKEYRFLHQKSAPL